MGGFLSFLVFLFGVCVGSFLGVLVDRLPRKESVLKGRSYCENCKEKLRILDLIPLLSFVFLKGRCRYCQSPLSFYYPLIELFTGLLFVLMFIFLPTFNFLIISSLIVIFFTDLKYGIIPDKIIYPSIIISALYLFLVHNSLFIIHFLSAFGAFMFFLLLFLITRGRGMGFGDIKLTFLMGLVLGYPLIIVSLYLAFLTGALVSIILVIWGKKKLKGGTVPFGPFLVFSTLLALFFGEKITEVFLQVLPLLSF